MATTPIAFFAALPLAMGLACGSSEPAPRENPDPISFTVGSLALEAGVEDQRCASYTLNNDEPLYVQAVHMNAGPAVHHSNWFFFSDGKYEGPDGFWNCDERGFDEVAGAVGGGFLFAQSTQAASETQSFADGAVTRIPAGSRIVGSVHLLNAADTSVQTFVEMEIDTIPEVGVTTRLQPLLFDFLSLAIPPMSTTAAGARCDFSDQIEGTMDFNIHYFLPHYHDLGIGADVRIIGGEHDGELVFSTDQAIGAALGERYDPPLPLGGATGLDFRCHYQNPRRESVYFGYGDQEMCILFAFTDADVRFVSLVQDAPAVDGNGGDMRVEGDCRTTSLIPWR